ncbi:class I SAM-dependent methyltransferase [Actinomadura sp. DC4]|uniref:class I SAM-dependent methyltransferase n=1 Tax=Actinomadura sp. DC4 TaxID=3055069 RepID=UPI0025B21494|nr:class I SAM-dependent methyltransferase [Actinomadura sp. DC4]MDN3355663.1 class I SAM-dependent methyltransferase [Actinomadura sp. DC4]
MTTTGVPPAGDSALRDFYEDPSVPVSSGSGRAQRQLKMLKALLADADGPQVIVDVGCGDGAATGLVHRLGHTVIGIDWSVMALRHAQEQGLLLIRGAIDAPGLPLADGSVDVVILSEVIEHIVDTDSAIDEIHRILRPGGRLLLSTPNLAAWYNRGLLALGIQPFFSEVSLRGVYGRPGSQVAGHLHMFTKRALTGFLTARGFVCERVNGAPWHDIPAAVQPLDRLFCQWPSAASILLVQARRA